MKGYLTCDGIDLPECQKIYRSKQRERSVLWAQNNEEEGRETSRDEETIYLWWDWLTWAAENIIREQGNRDDLWAQNLKLNLGMASSQELIYGSSSTQTQKHLRPEQVRLDNIAWGQHDTYLG